ncbi:MAG TPA: type II toxin-antitoxin system RelE/ParE family toxin [Bryobacteraceae bacterium]
MSSQAVRIHPAALEEAEAATEWYRQRSVRAAEMFLDEIDRAIERIGGHSGEFPEYAFGTRRMVLQRFPYLVVFRETAAGVEIIAVAHGRRRPGYWRDRVE